MSTRRGFLAGVAGIAAVAGLAGCLGATEEPEEEEPGADTIFPAEGPALNDDLLTAVADPSLQVPPASFSCYQYEVQALAPSYELSDAVPRVGGSLLGLIDAEFDEIATADLGHLTGSFYNATARPGSRTGAGQCPKATSSRARRRLTAIPERGLSGSPTPPMPLW